MRLWFHRVAFLRREHECGWLGALLWLREEKRGARRYELMIGRDLTREQRLEIARSAPSVPIYRNAEAAPPALDVED